MARRTVLLLLAAVFVLGVAGCGGDDEEAEEEAAPAEEVEAPTGEPVKIGVFPGVTGAYAPFTPPALAGVEIAFDDINAAGGILGRPAEAVIADNKSTVEGAVSAFRKLVEVDQVVLLAGPESDGAVAVKDRLAENELPLMCPQCGTTELDTCDVCGKWVFRLVASDTDMGIAAAQLARDQGFDRVAILVEKKEGTLSPALVFKDVWEGAVRGQIVADVRFDPGKTSYAAEVEKAFAGNPQAVYLAAGFEAGITILREWERRGYGGKFFFSPDMIVPEISGLTEALADGVGVGITPVFDTTTPAWEPFAQKYEEKTGDPPSPGFWEAGHYDQIILLALAATAAGTVEGAEVAPKVPEVANPPGEECFNYADCVALLKQGMDIDYHGPSTSLDLNEFGNLASPRVGVSHIQDGEWVQVSATDLDPELKEFAVKRLAER